MTRRLVPGIWALFLLAAPLEAQSLRSRITDLFTFGDCGLPLCLDLSTVHGDHFIPSITEGQVGVIGFMTEAIGRSTQRVPLAATSSGETFSIVGGLPVRTSTSGGPIFGERSQTLGRGRFYLGANVTGINFTSISGAPLDNLVINFSHEDIGAPGLGDPNFENDLVQLQLALDVNIRVASLFATWGILDFVDLGVAIPFVRTSVRGASEAQIIPFGTGNTPLHFFAGTSADPVLRAAAAIDESATGIGDIVGRIKINLGQSQRAGAALLADVRFATGDKENLLGSGASAVSTMLVGAVQFGHFSPHINAGYLARSGELQNDAILVTLGFDNLMTEWATFAFDLVSEWQVGDNKIELPGEIVYTTPFDRRLPSVGIPIHRENVLNASAGVKFTVRGGTVLVVNGIVPLRDVGLQPDFVWTTGLEYAF